MLHSVVMEKIRAYGEVKMVKTGIISPQITGPPHTTELEWL